MNHLYIVYESIIINYCQKSVTACSQCNIYNTVLIEYFNLCNLCFCFK